LSIKNKRFEAPIRSERSAAPASESLEIRVKAQATVPDATCRHWGLHMTIGAEAGDQPAVATLLLEPVLDLGAAERLHARLTELRGQPLDIDASQVERLGGLCLQVLISARNTWRAEGLSAVIGQPSSAFEDAWAMFAAPALQDDPPHPFGTEGLDA
jgi:chemotaxis protein CheX